MKTKLLCMVAPQRDGSQLNRAEQAEEAINTSGEIDVSTVRSAVNGICYYRFGWKRSSNVRKTFGNNMVTF